MPTAPACPPLTPSSPLPCFFCAFQDVENIAALPVEAAQAEDMLREGANLLQVRGWGMHCGRGLVGEAQQHKSTWLAVLLHDIG